MRRSPAASSEQLFLRKASRRVQLHLLLEIVVVASAVRGDAVRRRGRGGGVDDDDDDVVAANVIVPLGGSLSFRPFSYLPHVFVDEKTAADESPVENLLRIVLLRRLFVGNVKVGAAAATV